MFTSRAEYRLQLREDNADLRLTETGRRLGIIDDARWQAFGEKREAIERETARLKGTWARPASINKQNQIDTLGQPIEREHSLFDLLRRPNVSYGALRPWMAAGAAEPGSAVAEQVE